MEVGNWEAHLLKELWLVAVLEFPVMLQLVRKKLLVLQHKSIAVEDFQVCHAQK